jgi:hypothetical protein
LFRLAIAAGLLLATPAFAQETRKLDPGAKSPPAKIEQLAWLTGTWRGEAMGAPATEVYSSPEIGQISGHFMLQDGKGGVRVYELQQFKPVGDSIVYSLRHLNYDLTGWEDSTGKALQFPLVAIEGDTFYFDKLTVKREGPDKMTIWINIQGKDQPFRYTRGKP